MMKSSIRHFFRAWLHHTGMQVATLTVLTATFFVVYSAAWLHQNLDAILTRWGESIQISIYLKDEVTSSQRTKIQDFIGEQKGVKKLDHLTKEKARELFSKRLGNRFPDLLNEAEIENPLPESFELFFDHEVMGKNAEFTLKKLSQAAAKLAGVDDVSYGEGWANNYNALIRAFNISSYFIILILLVGGLFVIGNSIRGSIAQRRDEIEILELIGATRNMIRFPYIVEGAIMGFIASLLAHLASNSLATWQTHLLAGSLNFWTLGQYMESVSWVSVFALLFAGTVLGALGAYFCVRNLSNGWSAATRLEL